MRCSRAYEARAPMKLTAIVPATDAPATLGRVVAAIEAATAGPDEVIVVTQPGHEGPAAARNLGAGRAAGDVLVFVDSDVVVHPDVFERIRAAFDAKPDLAAVFGSYDDRLADADSVSAFRNMLHREVHTTSAGEATTFWAGLGAVRRDVFLGVGGFDPIRYPEPAIEDIELGLRLNDAGCRIVLDPEIQGTHLKRWSLAQMVRTDLLSRGAPWVALMVERREMPTALNLGWRHRFSALASVGMVAAGLRGRGRAAAAALGAVVILNGSLYRRLWEVGGPRLALPAPALHVVHHLTSVAAVPVGVAIYARQTGWLASVFRRLARLLS